MLVSTQVATPNKSQDRMKLMDVSRCALQLYYVNSQDWSYLPSYFSTNKCIYTCFESGFRAYRDKSSILFGNLCGNLSGNLSGNSQLGPSLEKFIRKSSWAGIHCWESCLDISWKCINFAELSLLSLNIFLGKFVYFSILDEKIHNYVKKSCEFYHPKIEKYTHFTLKILANMATSGGHFSHPSGMGGYWGYSGWKIFEMAIIRKEWH